MSKFTTNQLFDLVAPIAITGGADCDYINKAKKAWTTILTIPADVWETNNCPSLKDFEEPLSDWDLDNSDDFNDIYMMFALPAYDALFESIVGENGDGNWESGHDYWGAKGFKRPGDTSKSFTLAGDSPGQYPWYETAELLIESIKRKQH